MRGSIQTDCGWIQIIRVIMTPIPLTFTAPMSGTLIVTDTNVGLWDCVYQSKMSYYYPNLIVFCSEHVIIPTTGKQLLTRGLFFTTHSTFTLIKWQPRATNCNHTILAILVWHDGLSCYFYFLITTAEKRVFKGVPNAGPVNFTSPKAVCGRIHWVWHPFSGWFPLPAN